MIYVLWLLIGYGVASVTVDTTPPEITGVKICAEKDLECQRGWVK